MKDKTRLQKGFKYAFEFPARLGFIGMFTLMTFFHFVLLSLNWIPGIQLALDTGALLYRNYLLWARGAPKKVRAIVAGITFVALSLVGSAIGLSIAGVAASAVPILFLSFVSVLVAGAAKKLYDRIKDFSTIKNPKLKLLSASSDLAFKVGLFLALAVFFFVPGAQIIAGAFVIGIGAAMAIARAAKLIYKAKLKTQQIDVADSEEQVALMNDTEDAPKPGIIVDIKDAVLEASKGFDKLKDTFGESDSVKSANSTDEGPASQSTSPLPLQPEVTEVSMTPELEPVKASVKVLNSGKMSLDTLPSAVPADAMSYEPFALTAKTRVKVVADVSEVVAPVHVPRFTAAAA